MHAAPCISPAVWRQRTSQTAASPGNEFKKSLTTLKEAVMTSRNNNQTRMQKPSILAALLAAALAGCSGSGDSEDTVAVNGDVAIAYAKRVNTLGMNPTDGAPFAAGGDLIIREKSSPSAPEHNITKDYTRGA